MKKIYIFTALFFFFSTLLPFFNVYADDIVYDNNLITITPSATSEEITKGNGIGLITELLRQGGSIDFRNSTGTFANFFDNMIESFDSVLTNSFGTSSGLQDIWINPFDFSFNSLTTYINPTEKDPRLKNALKNYRLNIQYQNTDNNDNSITILPDLEFLTYINDMYVYNQGTNECDCNYFSTFNGQLRIGQDNNTYWLNYNPRLYTIQSNNNIAHVPTSEKHYDQVYYTSSPIVSIYLTTNQDDSISAVYSASDNVSIDPEHNIRMGYNFYYRTDISNWEGPFTNTRNMSGDYRQASFNSITLAANYIYAHYSNINLYLDNQPLALVGQTPTIGIGTNTIIAPYDQPVEYNYNQPVYIIPSDIYDRLELLFNQKVQITFDDIKDLIFDVNGQTALAVYEVQYENLDLMYNEKYEPYTSVPYFNKEKIGEMISLIPFSFVDDGIVVVSTAVSPIPSDILIVFGILFVFVLFACIINRLLE